MLKQLCLYVVLFLTLTTQKCCVSSGGPPSNTMGTIAANRYNTHAPSEVTLQQQQQQKQQAQHAATLTAPYNTQQQQHHSPAAGASGSSSSSGSSNIIPASAATAGASHALYHPAPGSGVGHVDHRNSYNLLSEAMSQAVSNEFSALGSGSADGACHADDLDCYSGTVQDRLGMEAIATLHRQLDDDDNGNIDLSESDDFLREELKYDSGYEKRQKAFHFNDDMHISVKELWEAWLRSEVHNWTIEQTTDWLAQSVQLPQYVEVFKVHKVSGAALPRLAVNNMHYVGNVLGIKDPIHKQKIALKAMDVVLFGPPRETGARWKDYILVALLLSAIIGCWYAYQQNKNAKRHLRRMAQDMEGLQRAEQSLQEMQKELERARMEQENVATEKMDLERRLKEAPALSTSSSDLEVQQLKKEIEMLRTELSRAEIELVDNCWAPPPQLQSWLQYTYELENKNHLKKRVSAEKQLQSAREACEKLRKKRSSLVGAFVSTHGKSIDDVDRSIVEARNSLGEVTNELQERLHRWKQIESCLGLNIVNNNGLPYLESILYGRNGGGGSGSKGSRGRMTSSTDDLDDDSVQGMHDNYSRSSASVSVSGGLGGGINSSCNTVRDDSSGSEDGDTQSVQFYLGSAPTPPIISNALPSVSSSPAAVASAAQQRALLSIDVAALNHVGSNHVVATSSSSSASTPAPPLPPPIVSSPPPPLPPHTTTTSNTNTNAHHHNTNFSLNDSITGDDSHSPSVSSERSIPVPPRTKKQTLPPVVPPPPSAPIGRTPLPPPRKTNQSQMLRSQSTDLVPMEIYTSYLSARQQQQQLSSKPGSGQQLLTVSNGISGGGGGGVGGGIATTTNKKMVKQHSSASQQSTSSTSSSVQSAPPAVDNGGSVGGGGKGQSPGRWSSHERIIANHGIVAAEHQHQLLLQQHRLQQQLLQQQQQQQPQYAGEHEPVMQSHKQHNFATAAVQQQQKQMSAAHSLQSLSTKQQHQQQPPFIACATTAAAATSAATVTPAYGDTKMLGHIDSAHATASSDSASLDGSLKKRKRRLRFPGFGSKKSGGSNSGGKSKLT